VQELRGVSGAESAKSATQTEEGGADAKDKRARLISAMQDMAERNGKEMFARAKLMLVGEGRAGKTTTLHSLLGKQFNAKQHSTQGADSHDMAVTVDSMDVCKWKVCP
tara:strand:+ start:178 stop:501 length:324 start_codon:yes stop_codon:yes gene_type:complete